MNANSAVIHRSVAACLDWEAHDDRIPGSGPANTLRQA